MEYYRLEDFELQHKYHDEAEWSFITTGTRDFCLGFQEALETWHGFGGEFRVVERNQNVK